MIKPVQSERGLISLITTIIFSLLFGLIVLGLSREMISELRQQTDDETSMRAYLAADSGVEDALRQIRLNPGYTNSACSTALVGTGYAYTTCTVVTQSGQPSGTLSTSDKATQIDAQGGFNTMTFDWDRNQNNFCILTPTTTAASWSGGGCAAPLEVTVVQYPAGTFSPTDANLLNSNVLFLPAASGPSTAAFPFSSNPVYVSCSTATSYYCHATITGLNPNPAMPMDYIFRIRTRYVGTDYQMTASNAVTGVVPIPDGGATIDSTAKSGSSYRRLLYKVPFSKGVAAGLDYVVYSDTNVCKQTSIVDYPPQITNSCSP